jgi:hypothetical protein
MTKHSKFDERSSSGQALRMAKTTKKTKAGWGGKRPGAGAPEGNANSAGFGAPEGNQNAKKSPKEKSQKKGISPRLEPDEFAALEARAEKNGRSATKEAEEILRVALKS